MVGWCGSIKFGREPEKYFLGQSFGVSDAIGVDPENFGIGRNAGVG